MPSELLPASAAAFAPYAAVSVVLKAEVPSWLTETLIRMSKTKDSRAFKTAQQHQIYLVATLSSPNAIWALASLPLPKAYNLEYNCQILLLEYKFIYIEAYIIYVDMVTMTARKAKPHRPSLFYSLLRHHSKYNEQTRMVETR